MTRWIRCALLALVLPCTAANVYVECESFQTLGGWVVDPHAMRSMGSAYVMAHGCGVPVADAVTDVTFTEPGTYAVWARTRNWNAEWTSGAAGRFRLVLAGAGLPAPWTGAELGTGGKDWAWQKAGAVTVAAGTARLSLRDLTGFNGRCDAVCFTSEDDAAPERMRRARLAEPPVDAPGTCDLIVVGGGVSGCAAALAASRYNVKTLLLQDRGVLGGCNSSEIRVSTGGYMHTGPYPALGGVLDEILPVRGDYGVLPASFYEDDRKANAFTRPEQPARLKLNTSVYAVEKDAGGRITAVLARDTRTAKATRYRAAMFVDATGDGVIARLAGCGAMYGREARSRWNESCAPETSDRQVMGHSIQWTTVRDSAPAPFPDIDWGLPFDEEKVHYVSGGTWWQEAGQYRDMAEETETIRDYGLLAIFSNWSYMKNRSAKKDAWRTARISWVSPVGGKRESYRIYGDYVMTETDLETQRAFDDGTAVVTWDIDFHYPDPANVKQFGEPFRSCAYHRGFGAPVAVPYRCLYARDCANLFLAGRDISVSHGAFAAVRVQRTLGMLAEVVGIAAGICREKDCTPRDVYAKHLSVLKDRMRKGVPKLPQYVAFGGGMHEKYHFPDLGFVSVWPHPATNLSPRAVEAIRSLKPNHRHRHPELDADAPVVEGSAFGFVRRVDGVPDKASALFLDGDTLYCGANNALYALDVARPREPRVVGVCTGIGAPRQLVAQNGIVYVATRETGLWVIDARDRAAPKVLTRFDTIELATGIDVCGPVLFVGQRQNGVEFIDVSDPAHPAHIRIVKTSESQSVVYRNGYLYSGDWGRGEITTIDARDMADVRIAGLTPLRGHGDGVATFGDTLFAATGHHFHDRTKSEAENFGKGHGLEIFSLADPAKPAFVSRVQFPTFYTLGADWWTPRPSADGKTVFVADTHNGFFAVDWSDPAAPRQFGRVRFPNPQDTVTNRPSAAVASVAVGDGAVYVAVAPFGLQLVESPRAKKVTRPRYTPPKNPGFRADYPTPADSRFTAWLPRTRAQVRGAAAYGRFLYVACGAAGLSVLERAADGSVREVRHFDRPFCGDVKVKGSELFAAEGLEGLAVYDLADPLDPKETARCRDLGATVNCAIWVWVPNDRYIVVSNRENGYLYLDATDRQNMKCLFRLGGCPGWDRYVADAVVGGRWFAQSTSNTGFNWVDLGGEKPVSYRFAGRQHTSGLNDGCLAYRGRLLRMTGGRFALLDPGQMPDASGICWKGPRARRLDGSRGDITGQPAWDGASRLALTRRIAKRVSAVDVTDVTAPKELWTEDVCGQPDTAVFWNGRMTVPCGYQGLLIEKRDESYGKR